MIKGLLNLVGGGSAQGRLRFAGVPQPMGGDGLVDPRPSRSPPKRPPDARLGGQSAVPVSYEGTKISGVQGTGQMLSCRGPRTACLLGSALLLLENKIVAAYRGDRLSLGTETAHEALAQVIRGNYQAGG
jgi:hypothetical protein